jgi:outer membrane lipoprotein-sorting protein
MIYTLFSILLLQATDPQSQPVPETVDPADDIVSEVADPVVEDATSDATTIAGINAAINAIDTMRARFEQISPDGSVSAGLLSMSRPGRLRFEYDDPSPILMVADGTTIGIEDRALETVDRVPLSSTPLWWLLKRDVDLAQDADIIAIERQYGYIYLTLRDPSGEMEGQIVFAFTESDYELREWYVTDAFSQVTRVSLVDVELGMRLSPRLFVIPEPERDRRSRRDRR